MSKSTISTVPIVLMAASAIHWFQGEQSEERYGSFGDPLNEFPDSFARRGWDLAEKPVIAYRPTKKQAAEAIAERRALVEEWEKADEDKKITLIRNDDAVTQITLRELATFARKLWTDPESGAWLEPEAIGVVGNRRGYAIPASVRAWQVFQNRDDVFSIPVLVREYEAGDKGARQRFYDRLAENSEIGRSKYAPAGMLHIAVQLVRESASESAIERNLGVKRGVAQQLYGWAMLARKFPKLRIEDRVRLDKPETKKGEGVPYVAGGYVHFPTLNASAARTLLGTAGLPSAAYPKGKIGSLDQIAMEAMGFAAGDEKAIGAKATESQVEKYIELSMAAKRNVPSVMDKVSMTQHRDSSPSEAATDLLSAILENSPEKLSDAIDQIKALEDRVAQLEEENATLKSQLAVKVG